MSLGSWNDDRLAVASIYAADSDVMTRDILCLFTRYLISAQYIFTKCKPHYSTCKNLVALRDKWCGCGEMRYFFTCLSVDSEKLIEMKKARQVVSARVHTLQRRLFDDAICLRLKFKSSLSQPQALLR